MNKEQTPRLEVTYDVNEDGGETRMIEGRFLDRPGWTFHASLEPQLDWESDAHTEYGVTRLSSYGISQDGERFYTTPGSDYDGDSVTLTSEHYEMLREVDLHFGPSPDERQRAMRSISDDRQRVFEALSACIDETCPKASPVAIELAADDLKMAARERGAKVRRRSLSERASAAREDHERGS